MFWLLRDTEKSRLEAKTEKVPSQLRQAQTHTDSKFSHKQILLLLETKPILNVINYHVKIHWLFIFPHRNPSIWAHLVLSIERIKYGFEDRHRAGQHQVT